MRCYYLLLLNWTYQHGSSLEVTCERLPRQLVYGHHHPKELEPYCPCQGQCHLDLQWFRGTNNCTLGSNKRKLWYQRGVASYFQAWLQRSVYKKKYIVKNSLQVPHKLLGEALYHNGMKKKINCFWRKLGNIFHLRAPPISILSSHIGLFYATQQKTNTVFSLI